MEFNWVMFLVGLGLVFGGFYIGRLTMLIRVINNPMWAISVVAKYNKEHVKMLNNLPAPTPQEIEEIRAKLKAMRDSRGQ